MIFHPWAVFKKYSIYLFSDIWWIIYLFSYLWWTCYLPFLWSVINTIFTFSPICDDAIINFSPISYEHDIYLFSNLWWTRYLPFLRSRSCRPRAGWLGQVWGRTPPVLCRTSQGRKVYQTECCRAEWRSVSRPAVRHTLPSPENIK